MSAALICLLSTLALVNVCRGQQGYSIRPGRVEVDSREHWERWQFAANTIEITEDGVRPAFIRKSTRVEGEELPGINASLNASRFGGGALAAGSNYSGVANLMDGRLDTYWEPDMSYLIEDWWVQIDLGRTVSATRIVLVFVGEELGDPFLQFKVVTAQGDRTLGNLKTRTRFTTSKPIKNERVFEIDLTKQLATTFPNVRGDFTGDVIRYVGVGVTDSDFGRGRQVSQAEYENLTPDQQGDIQYFRRAPSGRVSLLERREEWDALAGTESQGPVIYYRRERPRLAEIQVWTVGDNIGTGVLERGGTVTSWENNGAESAVVNGDYFGEVVYWPASMGFNPDRLLPSDPPDVERSLIIDLAGSYFLDNIRVLLAAGTTCCPGYRIQVSDGTTHAGGSLAWKTVGSIENPTEAERFADLKFPLTKAEHVAFTYRLRPNGGRFGVSEIQMFGEGFMPESLISSTFEGASPFIEVGSASQNLASIEWEADVPPGTDLILQTRTGNTVETITHYYKKNGEEYPGTEEEAAEAHASDKKFFGENSVGPVIAETIAGSDWSGWSQRYYRPGDKITSPSPRRFVAVRATFLTGDPAVSATLRSLALDFVTPVAREIVGEVVPPRLENIGRRQELSYFVRSTFEPGSRGFDQILIEAPAGVEMKLGQVAVDVPGQAAQTYAPGSDGLEVVMEDADSLWVRLPAAIKTTNGSALVELQFEATIFAFNTFFIGSAGHSDFENSWQRVDDGDANGIPDSETTVVLALERGEVLGDIDIDASVTPNGDGVNDVLTVAFSLMRLGAATPVLVEVYDLSGRLISTLHDSPMPTGRHSLFWSGVNQSGERVPPGLYLLRIEVDVDSEKNRKAPLNRILHVAY